MARQLEWRRIGGRDPTVISDPDRADLHIKFVFVDFLAPGETLVRFIADIQWIRLGDSRDTEQTHRDPFFIGAYVGITERPIPTQDPITTRSRQEWFWWQHVPMTHQFVHGFSDSWDNRGTAHVDIRAQRRSPSGGATEGRIFVISAERDFTAAGTGARDWTYGVQALIMLPEGVASEQPAEIP